MIFLLTTKKFIVRSEHGMKLSTGDFNSFLILTTTFRHAIDLHGYVFHAVANLKHVSMELGEPLFGI